MKALAIAVRNMDARRRVPGRTAWIRVPPSVNRTLLPRLGIFRGERADVNGQGVVASALELPGDRDGRSGQVTLTDESLGWSRQPKTVSNSALSCQNRNVRYLAKVEMSVSLVVGLRYACWCPSKRQTPGVRGQSP